MHCLVSVVPQTGGVGSTGVHVWSLGQAGTALPLHQLLFETVAHSVLGAVQSLSALQVVGLNVQDAGQSPPVHVVGAHVRGAGQSDAALQACGAGWQ
jgi:hypothetical protein